MHYSRRGAEYAENFIVFVVAAALAANHAKCAKTFFYRKAICDIGIFAAKII